MEIFKWLDDEKFVFSYTINDFREFPESYYLNLEIRFNKNTVLYVREYVEASRRKYAFHWQQENGELLVRWDNAPHFPNLPTFPHHKHRADGTVQESTDISLDDVFEYIKKELDN
ncbi:toxin-antitoxin system TumE family protein [Dyadobacter psychrophilus]|uniref:Uncharacterized protein n=1 Tax=Dyadobacter psychrophilus TaxID=651661 RepID=A0A1T5BAJ4_9BACT|nr:DUF6516 family protein [Dyadobacter psychrophilus]SKB44292.1 hypothetical protein SAMN05660293_00193 [Dyadobacter psychrophilus]